MKKIKIHRYESRGVDNTAEVGSTFTCMIQDMASDGRGVADHPSGRKMFVAGAWLGETVLAKIVKIKGRIGEAVCVEIDSLSDDRVKPECPHHGFSEGECGGCPWQSISYEAQLSAKQKRVESTMLRLDQKLTILQIKASPKILGYRNRAQFKSDGKRIGYVSQGSNTLAPIESCRILTEKNQQTLRALLNKLPNDQWAIKKKQKWTTIDVDETVDGETASVNQRLPFQQGNTQQNEIIKQWLEAHLITLDKKCAVLELFCGRGNLTQIIEKAGFKKVYAADIAADEVSSLQDKYSDNVMAISADLFNEEGLDRVLKVAKGASVLVLDPPRDGLKVLGKLFPKKPKFTDVIYISCDLATLSRDIKNFQNNGYYLNEVQPIDMFPHTPHIELLVHLSIKKATAR